MNQTSKSERERLVFAQFVEAMKWPAGAVESRDPPEPDILYAPRAGQSMAFELGEILYQPLAAASDRTFETLEQSARALEAMPERELFRQRFHDAVISPTLAVGTSKQARIREWPKLLQELLKLPPDFQGRLSLDRTPVGHVFRSVNVRKLTTLRGVQFFSTESLWIGDPSIELIEAKLAKTYEAQGPLHLLAYFVDNAMMPSWHHDLTAHLDGKLDPVQFETISVFDVSQREVLFRWTRPAGHGAAA